MPARGVSYMYIGMGGGSSREEEGGHVNIDAII